MIKIVLSALFFTLFFNLSAQEQENQPIPEWGIKIKVYVYKEETTSFPLFFPNQNEWEKITQQENTPSSTVQNENTETISLKIFDVRDLIEGENFYSPSITVEALLHRIQSEIAPESWKQQECQLEIKSNSLIVKNTGRTHEQIASLLMELRRKANLSFNQKFKKVSANNPILAEILKNNKNQMIAPHLLVFDEQAFKLSCLEQTSYLKEYVLNRNNEAEIVDPVIGIVNSGVTISGTLNIENVLDGTFQIKEFCIELEELKKPIEEHTTEFGKIQIPQTCSWSFKTSYESFKTSENLIVGPIAQTWEDSLLYFVISAEIVALPK